MKTPDVMEVERLAIELGMVMAHLRLTYECDPLVGLDLYRQVLGTVPPSVLLHLTGAKEPHA